MDKLNRSGRRFATFAVLVTALLTLTGFATGQSQAAPIPPALLNGRKIFVSNGGADSGLFPHPFSGGPERAYNQLYVGLQKLGRYELVANPADADLVFEIQLAAPNGPSEGSKVKGASDPLPMFRVQITDRPTHYVVWVLTRSIEQANLQKTHDHNFDEAIASMLGDLKTLLDARPAAK